MPEEPTTARVTIPYLHARKARGQRISMLTAYDYPTALLQDQAGIDVVLVGDSVGTNVLGYRSPQQVTMADMLHHAQAVRRGLQRAFLVVDLPFMSYQPSVELALLNAGRLVQEGGADGVKLEGGRSVRAQVEAIVQAGIPVMGHLGITPQSQSPGTIPRAQGRLPQEARDLLDEALLLEQAGIFALILELVAEEVAGLVAERLSIPVIGIGAGRRCDGQVLVVTDVLGLSGLKLRLAKSYAALREDLVAVFRQYREEVEQGLFPTADHAFHVKEENLRQVQELLQERPGA